jgi:hypothetical protein
MRMVWPRSICAARNSASGRVSVPSLRRQDRAGPRRNRYWPPLDACIRCLSSVVLPLYATEQGLSFPDAGMLEHFVDPVASPVCCVCLHPRPSQLEKRLGWRWRYGSGLRLHTPKPSQYVGSHHGNPCASSYTGQSLLGARLAVRDLRGFCAVVAPVALFAFCGFRNPFTMGKDRRSSVN